MLVNVNGLLGAVIRDSMSQLGRARISYRSSMA